MDCKNGTKCPIFGTDSSKIEHNVAIYRYPCGSMDVLAAQRPIFREPGWEQRGREAPAPAPREPGGRSEGADMVRSMRRARAKVRRLALANDFAWFVTLTLDPAKIDRYDPAAVTKALNRWADNMVRRHGLRYILVPERHKDGAFHFHGFLAGQGVALHDSGVRWEGRPVYNLPQWTLGFSTAQDLYGEYPAAVAYCCKYIGKQDGQRPLGRWYYSGGPLQQPERLLCDASPREIEAAFPGEGFHVDIPGDNLLIIHTKMTKE